jgi:hypothetical protein
MNSRICTFCLKRDLPDGTIIFVGITACPDCLKTEAAKNFRKLLASQKRSYNKKFNLKVKKKCLTAATK